MKHLNKFWKCKRNTPEIILSDKPSKMYVKQNKLLLSYNINAIIIK